MYKSALLLVLVLFFPLLLSAQDYSGIELYGGYQYTHFQPSLNTNGWNAGLSANVTNWFGIKLDFGGAYKNDFHFQTYMLGPEFSYRRSRVFHPFGYAVGGAETTYGSGPSYTGFSMALGGGLDLNFGDSFAVRIVQADWMPYRSGNQWIDKNVRVSTGIVFRFW